MTDHELRPPGRHSAGQWAGVPRALQGTLFDRLRGAWAEARERRDSRYGPLVVAIGGLARYARTNGLPIGDVLRALNAVIDPRLGGDSSLLWDGVREHAGEMAIASYYRDD